MLPLATPAALQLLLFVDDRPSSRELVRDTETMLHQYAKGQAVQLQVIDVTGQPQLAELFRIVLTPALLKLTPPPRQVIAGKNLLHQIENHWQDWCDLAHQRESFPADEQTLTESISGTTEIIRLADEVFRLTQEKSMLEERVYFKDRVLAMLAHDLRNPLTAISLALDTIDMGGAKITPEMFCQLLKHARLKVRAADLMITDILEAGRSSNVQFQTKRQRLQLAELCHHVANDFYIQECLSRKGQRLILDIPNDLPLVFADEERIRQVLLNLLGNAIKYTPPVGTIEMAALHRTAQKVEVAVTDDGPGVPAELREQIFEELYRLERDDQSEGYGIGLALCRRIIRAHYGQIWVDAASGKQGSSFRFTLPVY
ncbi:MAG: histidine kinase [Oscillatoriales cyanobacterium SM2_2_1]|nr:histidine kinase [Oscillatoriales cyanobacterium SM2_2_1]